LKENQMNRERSGILLLLGDDTERERSLAWLRGRGYRAEAPRTAADAAAMDTSGFGLVVVDPALEARPGFEGCARVGRQLAATTTTLLVCNNGAPANAAWSMPTVRGTITRPMDERAFVKMVETSFGTPQDCGRETPLTLLLRSDVVPLSELEAAAIRDALRKLGGNVTLAAKRLGIGRTTLYRKGKKYGIRLRGPEPTSTSAVRTPS
jgi:ActR/RegA family two-component response regulator